MSGLSGVSFTLREYHPTTSRYQAGFTGVSFGISPKSLLIKVYRFDLVTRQYVPVRDVKFNVMLTSVTETITTNVLGTTGIDFPDTYIEVAVEASTLPNGYHYATVHRIQTLAKNYLTLALLPDALDRSYTQWDVL